MFDIGDLDREISDVCAEMVRNGMTPKNWVVQRVMSNHSDLSGADVDMALCCMRETVSGRVNKHFSKLKASEDDGKQEVLPGFERLQRRYIITRDKEQAIVSVYDMTDEELELKAEEMEAMAEGCLKHADELRKFKEDRLWAKTQ